MARLFRLHWKKAEAVLLDQRFAKFTQSSPPLQRWEYLVELPGPDGAPVRLTFQEYVLKGDPPPIGQSVPVLVNRARTKAMFDVADPRINRTAKTNAQLDARRADDEERFRKKLDGRG